MLPISPARTFVKICGITSREDAGYCLEAGADAIGINLYPQSKRFHPVGRAQLWLGQFTGAGYPSRVALFVNAPLDEIRAAIETGMFDAIQLHGNEAFEFCASIKSLGLPLIRAVALRVADDLDQLDGHPADAFILDAYARGSFGGTGQLSDWALAAEAVRRFPEKPIFLSGGLTPENVSGALAHVRSSGVDVASGVESVPGVKDQGKIRAFVAAARAATQFPTIPIDN